MKTELECLPCLTKHLHNIISQLDTDETARLRIMRACLRMLSETDLTQPPPYSAWQGYQIASRECGVDAVDPYCQEKRRSAEMAWKLYRELPQVPGYDETSFESRVRAAVAGNILDFSIYADLELDDARKVVCEAFEKPIDVQAIAELKHRMDSAKRILYVLDNCGEAVFDRALMEPYREKITICTRGKNTSNDMTPEMLELHGLKDFVASTIDNGTSLAGIIPAFSGKALLQEMAAADVIVCKGQGNFECLEGSGYPLSFLFMAKCPVVTALLGAEPRSLQVINQ